jgi:quercetin dioxygenase-like cupin family protein
MRYGYLQFYTAILDFPLPVRSYNIPVDLIGLLDPEYMGVVVDIPQNKKIETEDIFYAMPVREKQITANDMSKYTEFYAKEDIRENKALSASNTIRNDTRGTVYNIIQQVKQFVLESGVPLSSKVDIDISHHYGIDKFSEFGVTIFNIINREYCKKLLILLPMQEHPEHYHKIKEETFHILYGKVWVNIDGKVEETAVGGIITINRGIKHGFGSEDGAIIEEISSTHYNDDSYYTDEVITKNKNRKTQLTDWMD